MFNLGSLIRVDSAIASKYIILFTREKKIERKRENVSFSKLEERFYLYNCN